MIINGWRIYFIKKLFDQQRRDLQAQVRQLKQILPPEIYRTHSTVKLYAAIMVAIKEKIPIDPRASHFSLTGALKRYGRVKKMGLPERYRLFFRVLETEEQKAIFILWLGYPRKEGDKNDCYEVFTKMVMRGDFPDSFDALIRDSEE
ncbi:type II toxin-antitoxin system YhaV family toxin [Gloeocapsa sp. PCC 73106]|uniref:type II toxin-antitoxin system YhaV family toxin n=1 Tax=Gloeocapsa sp. PCC 73106 TaxID=102232 RepID=UPI0002ABFB4E|nr:type II toxin-antitoxin system YhaV family toxin [Gloeocapsa sp. PCC 73106]ELR98006.1 Toxin with endonuclease activity YhaV [Gloeocapsa sp. PCC 73106]